MHHVPTGDPPQSCLQPGRNASSQLDPEVPPGEFGLGEPGIPEALPQLAGREEPHVRASSIFGCRIFDERQPFLERHAPISRDEDALRPHRRCDNRVAVVETADEDASGPEHASHLSERPLGRGGVVKHAERVDDVECIVLEVQVFGVHGPEVRAQSLLLETSLRQLNAARGQVDAGHMAPGARELQVIRSKPNPDLEHPKTGEAPILKGVVHPWLFLIAVALYARERLRCSELFLPGRKPARRIVAPLLLGGQLYLTRPLVVVL